MNKSVLTSELSKIGIIINSFEFSSTGYCLELQMNFSKAQGWEELEQLPINGLEIAKSRQINEYVRQVVFIPSNEKEFKDYVRRYVKAYNLHKDFAFVDLSCIIEKFGSISAKIELNNYLTKCREELT